MFKAAPSEENLEGVRLVYVWWPGMPQAAAPMQLRFTGIRGDERMGPSVAGSQDDLAVQEIHAGNTPNATTLRWRLNQLWSQSVWSRLQDPERRMRST